MRFMWYWIYGCAINYPEIDAADDIGTFAGQPPLFMLHGTDDLILPYDNGYDVYKHAQSAGLSSQFVRMGGVGHVDWKALMEPEYLDKIWPAMADSLDLAEVPQPEGCQKYSGK